jgi:hypothetical protein
MRRLRLPEEPSMDHELKAFNYALRPGWTGEARNHEDWRRARAAHVGLLLMGMRRVNLLLVGIDGMVWSVLRTLLPNLEEPVVSWCPGESLVLPLAVRSGTLVLHDVGVMPLDQQSQLLKWLEDSRCRTQVISMTSTSLLPRVQSGTFIDTLYYRLNTVCVDVTA